MTTEPGFPHLRPSQPTAEQLTIGTVGGPRHWVTLYPVSVDDYLVIWGRAQTLAEAQEGEDPPIQANLVDLYARGYRFGDCYSEMCVEGEYGSTFVGDMLAVSEELFDAARMAGWPHPAHLLSAQTMKGDDGA